ncbi:MAG: hypothetical protein ACI82I_003194 [Gammaproteobacteria bacterium]|jgi:hypothetical protein
MTEYDECVQMYGVWRLISLTKPTCAVSAQNLHAEGPLFLQVN